MIKKSGKGRWGVDESLGRRSSVCKRFEGKDNKIFLSIGR